MLTILLILPLHALLMGRFVRLQPHCAEQNFGNRYAVKLSTRQ
ncbi:MAG: hypothetical protein ACU84J_14820 [Gammaproteobacteria bacterium]